MLCTNSYGRTDTYTRKTVFSSVGRGWQKILESLLDDLEKLGWDGEIHQVKEKFGGLRFYVGNSSPQVDDRIRKAEEESFKTCENCGEPGYTKGIYWVVTLCEKCEERE